MKVVVLTTSYPRFAGDAAGRFVADAVEQLRDAGVVIEVVSPANFDHHGIAYGAGIVGNLRARPTLALRVPSMLRAFRRTAAAAARDADLVHAHWLPAAWIGTSLGTPTVAQVWGTDLELARRIPALAGRILGRSALVVAPSTALADAARRLGARDVRVIPGGVDIPETVPEPDEPPHVLFAGVFRRR
jgi:hypothetical protein